MNNASVKDWKLASDLTKQLLSYSWPDEARWFPHPSLVPVLGMSFDLENGKVVGEGRPLFNEDEFEFAACGHLLLCKDDIVTPESTITVSPLIFRFAMPMAIYGAIDRLPIESLDWQKKLIENRIKEYKAG